jgi:23S rRNA (cytosine1962-C5)-methyltransferase
MTIYPKITLKRNKDQASKRFHPWIFSGAIDGITGSPADGDLVKVYSYQNEFIGVGHYSSGSIAIRILSLTDADYDKSAILKLLKGAYSLRVKLGLVDNPQTTAYRLVFGEGDYFPGLIIDIYNRTAVIQTHTTGMQRLLPEITAALLKIYGNKLESVYYKGSDSIASNKGIVSHFLSGDSFPGFCYENNLKFHINIEQGQKTGFFIDQRDNRALTAKYAKNSKVLNLFSYSGAFSIYCAEFGASVVHSVDSSAKACEWTEMNILLNKQDAGKHIVKCEDAIHYINHSDEKYNLMIIDPPAFAKHLSARHNALKAYKRINLEALKKIDKGGIIFSFSCSQVVDRNLFNSMIYSAAIESGRKVRVLHHLHQPADHPANIYFPEGEYLKGIVIYVE